MTTVLIVDDNAIDRRLEARFVEMAGMAVCFAKDGQEALDIIEQNRPDIVTTDMAMPVMDGLELTRRIRTDHPSIPMIEMVAYGTHESSLKALQIGGASYVPEAQLVRHYVPTIWSVLGVAGRHRAVSQSPSRQAAAHVDFVLAAARDSPGPCVHAIQEQLWAWRLCDEADLIRVGVAVQESLVNAIEHGCLEVDATLPDGDPNARQRLLDERRNQPPYCDRQVYVRTHLTVNEATITIRDEGPGFDVLALPDPTDPDNILRLPGRGRLLIHSFMDAVQFNAAANEITLVKRQLPAPRPF